jgi:glycerophosphoryl diester phosphodiesterase
VVDAAHAAGLQVTGWLGNREDDLDRLLAWGVDSITSDYPTQALAYLAGRTASTA